VEKARNSKLSDEQERVTEWPSKRNKGKFQLLVLQYLASKLAPGATHTEEVNALLNQYHTFNDSALLRREMVERRLIERLRDGSLLAHQIVRLI